MSRVGAFFDLDRTLVACNTGRLFLRDLRRRGEISMARAIRAMGWLARYHMSLIDLDAVAHKILEGLRGWSESEFEERCHRLVEKEVLPRLQPAGLRKIDEHRKAGHVLAILSTSPSYMTRPVARVLGMEHALSTQLEVESGLFTGRLISPACFGAGKVHWAEAFGRETSVDLDQKLVLHRFVQRPADVGAGRTPCDRQSRSPLAARGAPAGLGRRGVEGGSVSVFQAPWYTPAVQRLLDLALEEDAGRGDVTSGSVIDEGQEAEADIIAKERLVVCGLGIAEAVFTRFDWRTRLRARVADGDPVTPGTLVATVRGPAQALLAGERVALNFMQHLSGVATLTQAFVAAAEGAKVRVADTRKTTPGLRALEKYAVRVGGGHNHRADLSSGILIKDNHVALIGSVREAVRRARANASHSLRIEVEVDGLAELDEAIEAGAEVILLDNFNNRDIVEAVKRVRERAPRTLIEVSGGVTLDRMHELAKTGIDVISVGRVDPLGPRRRPVDGNPAGAGGSHGRRGARPVAAVRAVTVSAPTRLTTRRPASCRRACSKRGGWGGGTCTWTRCGSTNDVAAAEARAGAPEGLLVTADEQTDGRGRMGRTWHAPAGANLTFSLLLRPRRPAAEIPPITLLAGGALAVAVRGLGLGIDARVKWPNDLMVGTGPSRRKLAGILTEATTEGDRIGHVVVGIGLNVNAVDFPPELAAKATSLRRERGWGAAVACRRAGAGAARLRRGVRRLPRAGRGGSHRAVGCARRSGNPLSRAHRGRRGRGRDGGRGRDRRPPAA